MARKVRPLNLFIGGVFAAITVVIWALGNRPAAEPPWPTQVAGMSFSPLRMGNDPEAGEFPTREEISSDLALLAGKVRSIRTYGVGGTLADIPELARDHRMNVALGAWLTANEEQNDREVAKLIEVARLHKNVTRVFVGNETLLRGDLTAEQLAGYLDRVRKALKVPVSTGEPWHVWLKYPDLAAHADYVAASSSTPSQ